MHGARNKLMLNFGYRNRNLVNRDDMATKVAVQVGNAKREKVMLDWHVRQHTLRGCNLLK